VGSSKRGSKVKCLAKGYDDELKGVFAFVQMFVFVD